MPINLNLLRLLHINLSPTADRQGGARKVPRILTLRLNTELGKAFELVGRILDGLEEPSTGLDLLSDCAVLHTAALDTGLGTVLDLGQRALDAHRHTVDEVLVPSIGVGVLSVPKRYYEEGV